MDTLQKKLSGRVVETSQNLRNAKDVFPKTLENKKIIVNKHFKYYTETSIIDIGIIRHEEFSDNIKNYRDSLNNYLKLKNPKYLLESIKNINDTVLWNGRNCYSKYKTKYKNKIPKNVPDYFVIWESLIYWSNLSLFCDDYSIRSKAINNLKRIAPSLVKNYIVPELIISYEKVDEENVLNNPLVHVTYHLKGNKPFISYIDKEVFLQFFNEVKDLSKSIKNIQNSDTKKSELQKILSKNLKYLEIDDINLESIGTNLHVSNLIAIDHKKHCKFCKRNRLTKDNIYKLYLDAKKGIPGILEIISKRMY